MDGFEVCARLKNNLQTSHIPIILLTARGSVDAQVEGFETGADEYMTKPFNANLLNVRVRNLLNIRKKLQQRFQEQINIKSAEVTPSARDAEFIKKAIEIIDTHLDDPDFDGDTFAKALGVSRTGLYNKLKALTGKSINLFIRSLRLKRAAQLLIDGGIPVGDISFKVGFSNHSYFSRCFTKEFGVSPSNYLKSLKDIPSQNNDQGIKPDHSA